MHEILDQVMHYARAVWRFRWYIHAIAWPIAIVGWLVVASLPDKYESTARVFVDTKSMLRPLLKGLAVQSDVADDVKMMTRTLLSTPNLEKIARMADLDLAVNNVSEKEGLLEKLRKTIKFKGGRDNIYKIEYIDDSPEKVKKVVQSILTLFVESSLGSSREDSSSAQRFLDEQIAAYEQRLIDAENELKEFKRKNIALLPGRGGDYFEKLQGKLAELEKAEAQLSEVKGRRDEISRQIVGEEPTFGMMPSANLVRGGLSHPLDSRINELNNRADELLLKFTDRHPDVIAIKATIVRLEKQRAEELKEIEARLPKGQTITPLEKNPVYQQLKISLANTETEAKTLSIRVSRLRSEVKELEGAVDTIPAIEAEMKQLNRDYDINRKNYEKLVSRRESAKLAEQVDKSTDDVQFKVLDPPSTPLEPAGPKRSLFNLVVLLGGVVAGIAFAFLLSQIRPTFDST
ncbi:MAG: Wzz/FepE/Etk N-terminal domain-containing protein, partial [Gammaproteobacteria bacterium]|nr:Wzz/FepE/Etk N-terminal domain-containing protein [Gammaproteobacteria bacterium]